MIYIYIRERGTEGQIAAEPIGSPKQRRTGVEFQPLPSKNRRLSVGVVGVRAYHSEGLRPRVYGLGGLQIVGSVH